MIAKTISSALKKVKRLQEENRVVMLDGINKIIGLDFLKTDIGFLFEELSENYTETEIELLEDKLIKELLKNKDEYALLLKKSCTKN